MNTNLITRIDTKLGDFWEWLAFPPRPAEQQPLPAPPEKRQAKPVSVPTAGARLVNRETCTWEWDIARARPAQGSAEIADIEAAELEKRALKNWTWNKALKLARVQGQTIQDAATAAGCSFSYAQKVFAALSRFEAK